MSTPLTAPVDALHAECLEAREQIRNDIDRARTAVAVWQPKPWPGR